MRIFAFVMSVVVTTLILMGGIVLLVVSSPDVAPGALLAVSIGLSLIVLAPMVIGSYLAYWGAHPSDEAAQRYQRRGFGIVLAVEALGLIALVAGAIVGHVVIWYSPVMIVLAIVLTLLAVVIGRALHGYDVRHPQPLASDVDLSRAAHAKRIRTIAIVFFATLITGIVLVLLLLVQQADPLSSRELWVAVLYATIVACFAGAFATIFISLGLARRMRDAAGQDFASARRISRVVVRGKDEPLSDSDLAAAGNYALFASAYFRYQLAYFALLYAGIIGQGITQYAQGISTFGLYMSVALVMVFLVLLPILLRQARRTSLYAAEHLAPAGRGTPRAASS